VTGDQCPGFAQKLDTCFAFLSLRERLGEGIG
jgi:hypothetical protein